MSEILITVIFVYLIIVLSLMILQTKLIFKNRYLPIIKSNTENFYPYIHFPILAAFSYLLVILVHRLKK